MINVLLVDDEAMIRRGLRHLIPWRDLGFSIAGASGDGKDAVGFLEKGTIDIVLTDLKMPVMMGTSLAELIRREFQAVKVIVLTGYDDFNLIQKCLKEGVSDYLLKPVKRDLLIEALIKVRDEILTRRYPYPFKLEEELMELIENGSQCELKDMAMRILNDLEQIKAPLNIAERIIRNIIINIDKHLSQKGFTLNDSVKNRLVEMEAFSGFSAMNEAEKAFSSFLIEIQKNVLFFSGDIILQIKHYIVNNLEKNLSLKMVAGEFLLNPSYLSHIFKVKTDRNYMDYVTELRIDRAKTILISTTCSIEDTSRLAGYNDCRYFSRIFKRCTGMTPSQYAEKNRSHTQR